MIQWNAHRLNDWPFSGPDMLVHETAIFALNRTACPRDQSVALLDLMRSTKKVLCHDAASHFWHKLHCWFFRIETLHINLELHDNSFAKLTNHLPAQQANKPQGTWRYGSNHRSFIFKLIRNSSLTILCETVLWWIPQYCTYKRLALVQIIHWCLRVT